MKKFLSLLCAIAISSQLAMADSRQVMPLEPSVLITYLPATPSQWTMNVSTAGNNFTRGRVIAYAERDFKQNPPPPIPGMTPKPFVPATLKIFLSDTGNKNDFGGMFVAPATGSPQANVTYLQIKGMPARMIKADTTDTDPVTSGTTPADTAIRLNILIASRFLLEIRSTNLADHDLRIYANSLDFTKLLSVPVSAETDVSDPVLISRVDELHPQNTRSYPLFWNAGPMPGSTGR
jgi:hypothetical protein